MSRIGKKPIQIPEGVTVEVQDGLLKVKGKLGELSKKLHQLIDIKVENNEATVTPKNDSKLARSLWGTFASHLKNMIKGVTEGHQKELQVEGVGYKVNLQGNKLILSVGFSHDVEVEIPEGIKVEVEKNDIKISGIDKELVGQFAADVRAIKKPEPYKGKGIRYKDEVIIRKEGKKAAA